MRTTTVPESTRTSLQKGQGRPLGHLMAWLLAQGDYVGQQEHCHTFTTTRGKREEGRAHLYSLPGGQEFATAHERSKREGEGEEPLNIR